ncbi:ubiquinol-cytochrome C chaperone family protein [Emcibacter nanhaiensis]|uniref:Ubiquinol-cytochrome C chaperone n=1 Tax=Emcibacter nanhaiensis TaxID=1505037 RepID=A0A501PQC1_9PROT|nr:ubiquinol-cytochrome C chaperone family protein [Emcibacter nanhaiensis]TPD62719.1 ubiquinol-cytochrome C chaperone [Emcibacter nanhaiensis]
MFGLFSRKKKLKDTAYTLFSQVVDQARQPVFYEKLDVEDTLDGRFDMICAHMFMLQHRLEQEKTEQSGQLRRFLKEVMFENMDLSLREMGVGDLSVGKKIKVMAEAYYGRQQAYENALQEEEGLQEALARNIYRGRDVSAEKLKSLAEYMTGQIAALENCDIGHIYSGQQVFSESSL